MSKTDKTRPGWVQRHDSENRRETVVEHDHRTGECIVERLEDARWRAHSRGWRHDCRRIEYVDVPCDGKTVTIYTGDGYEKIRRCERVFARPGRFGYHQCSGTHTVAVRHPDRDCSGCDDRDAHRTTCEVNFTGRYVRTLRYYGRPKDARASVTAYHTRPDRHRGRRALHDLAREYNSHGEVDHADVVPPRLNGGVRSWL